MAVFRNKSNETFIVGVGLPGPVTVAPDATFTVPDTVDVTEYEWDAETMAMVPKTVAVDVAGSYRLNENLVEVVSAAPAVAPVEVAAPAAPVTE